MWYRVTVPDVDDDARYVEAADEQAAVAALFVLALNGGQGEMFRAEAELVTDAALVARLDAFPLSDGDWQTAATAAPFTPDAYQWQALATWRRARPPVWSGGLTQTFREQQLHALLGEAGETADLLKKHFLKLGHEAKREQVMDELADVAYYVAILAYLWGFTFDDMFAHLAQKLADGHGWVTEVNCE